ncbi:MAG TPA: hypothetical protein V6D50_12640 [Chroococcales cyanobacterium]
MIVLSQLILITRHIHKSLHNGTPLSAQNDNRAGDRNCSFRERECVEADLKSDRLNRFQS